MRPIAFWALLTLCLAASSAAAQDEPILEKVVWRVPPANIAGLVPSRTDDDYEGRIQLVCRIRSIAGDLKCLIVGTDPITEGDRSDLRAFQKAFESGRIDMAKTEGAKVGRWVRLRATVAPG